METLQAMDEVLQRALEQDSSVQHTITAQAAEMAALAQQSTSDAASAAETIHAFDRITPESTPAENWIDLFEAVIKQNAGRAGAGFLQWSGSTKN